MTLTVRSIAGLPGIPVTKQGVGKWLSAKGIATQLDGQRLTFLLADLPPDVRRAVMQRDLEAAGLPLGDHDDVAHAALANAPPKMRAEADRKAGIAQFLLTGGKALSWPDKVRAVAARFGSTGNSLASLTRLLTAVEGLDSINFAPALLADYHVAGAPRRSLSDVAWSYFLTAIRDGGESFPLSAAWQDVEDLKGKMGWNWASQATVCRRWRGLSVAQQLHARVGHEEAVKRLAQPALRDKTSILPMEWVSLDGRTKDFWALDNSGKPRRYTFLTLVDCATNFVLDWELAESENARATVRLIRRVCQTYGIFDRLYPDNGAAFAGYLVAGGAIHRFRNSGSKMQGVKPLGICHHLGIELHFAIPKNGQAKVAERTFATLSRVLDDRPEFKGAHAGHRPGASPDAAVVPIDLATAKAIIEREVHRHNAKTGRRGQGMDGRSYLEVFKAGMALRKLPKPTARQLYLAGLISTPVMVDRFGRVMVDNWTYGGPETQEDLLPYHKSGQAILLGRDPDDFSAPALAWNEADKLICEGIMPVQRGAYGSVDGVRDAARNRKAARLAVTAAAEANEYLNNAEFAAAMAAIPTPDGFEPEPDAVVAGRFGGALERQKRKPKAVANVSATPPEYLKNMDDWLAAKKAERRRSCLKS